MPRVNREKLLHALEQCQPGLAQKEILDQSHTFVFRGGMVWTFNDEVACRFPSPLGKSFEGAVQADKLLELLRKLSENDVELSAHGGELRVKGKGERRSGIRMEHEVRLPVASVEGELPEVWKPLDPDFCEAVGIVQACAGTDDSRFSLTCVHLTDKWVEACDFFHLCRWELDTGLQGEALIRKNAMRHVTGAGVEEMAESENFIHFRSPKGLVLSCRRYTEVEDFPELDRFFGIQGDKLVLPKGLAEAVEKAQIFTAGEGDEHDHVSIELKDGRLKIKGVGQAGWFSEVKKVDYRGKPLYFMIPPLLLADLVKKHSECVVNDEHLSVTARYKYLSCLIKPSDLAAAQGGIAAELGADEEEEEAPVASRRAAPVIKGGEVKSLSKKGKGKSRREEEE